MSRPSSIYRNSALFRRTGPPQPKHQDNFPLLDFKEISICLQSCNFRASEELVSKPTSVYVKTLLEQILDSFLGVTVENINRKAIKICNENLPESQGGELDEGVHSQESIPKNLDDIHNSLQLLMLSRITQRFLVDCGLHDFTLTDIIRPDPFRIRRILSAIVNYAKFREEHSVDCEELLAKSETNVERLNKCQAGNNQLKEQIEQLEKKLNVSNGVQDKHSNTHSKATLAQLNSYNSKLENELKRLKKSQEELIFEHTKYKNEKNRLIEKVEDFYYLIGEKSKEVEKLKKYIVSDPSVVKKVNEDLKLNAQQDQTKISDLEQQNRNLSVSIESFHLVESELKGIFRILEEILNDLSKEEDAIGKLNKYSDFLEQQTLELNDLNRQIQQLQRQSTNIEDKMTRLRQSAFEKSEEARKKLAKLNEDYAELSNSRKEKEEELNLKKARIADLEKKMAVVTQEFENESKEAQQEIQQLNSHIRLYLSEMSKRID